MSDTQHDDRHDTSHNVQPVEIRELSRDESIALIARHHVGRAGMSFHDLVRVELVAYLYADGWIYARTEIGEDLVMLEHHPWVAFEVDEVVGIYDWLTVEAWGSVEFLNPDFHSRSWHEFENAVRLLRGVVPQILTAEDPMPQRVRLLRMHIDRIAGREARSGSPGAFPAP